MLKTNCLREMDLSLTNFLHTMGHLKTDEDFIVLLDIACVDHSLSEDFVPESGNRFELNYLLLNLEKRERLAIKIFWDEINPIPSISHLYKAAPWLEREVWDLFGVTFSEQKELRLLNHFNFKGHPLRKDFDTDQVQDFREQLDLKKFFQKKKGLNPEGDLGYLDIGPLHSLTEGNLRIMLAHKGDAIVDSNLEIGFFHRGIEKVMESKHFDQITVLTNHLNSMTSAMNSIGWCKTIEDYHQIEIPPRAQALRMVFAELSRILDHFSTISKGVEAQGIEFVYNNCHKEIEKILKLFESYSGKRFKLGICQIGGIKKEPPAGWINSCIETIKSLSKSLTEIKKFLVRSRLWMDHTSGGAISAEDALSFGYSGPCLRATGINYDLRTTFPYYFYSDIDFEVPLGVYGSVYDRYLVRLEEIDQSIKIIFQVLDNLPHGGVFLDNEEISFPVPNAEIKKEKRRDIHSQIVDGGFCPKAGSFYSATEASNGELGYFVAFDGGPTPNRVKVHTPSFLLLQSFPHLIQGQNLSDLAATYSSLNCSPGEFDR